MYNRRLDLLAPGCLQEAVDSFSHAISLHPNDAQAYDNRGIAHLKLGDTEAARADWMRALELSPGMKEAEGNLQRLAPKAP